MSTKAVKILLVLLSLLALAVPSPARSLAGELPSDPNVSTEVDLPNLPIGETALVSVKLNNIPVEGYKSAEFTCTYDAGILEKSNIVVTDLFGGDAVSAISDAQSGMFIVAIAGANSNRAMTSGTAFTFGAKGLQLGQSAIQCTARVSRGDNLAIDISSTGAQLTVLAANVSPTPFVPATATVIVPELPTLSPNGSLSGQILASKPVTVRLLDSNQLEVTSVIASPDGTFSLSPLPGDYTLLASASGFLSYQGSATVTAGDQMVFPTWSLLAGDVDGNNVIDQFDALTIGMNYTLSMPEAADLNNDVVINFLDLELLAENYRQTGPTTGSASILGFLQKMKPTAISSPNPGATKIVIEPTVGSVATVDAKPTTVTSAETLIPPNQNTGTTGPGAPFANAPLCPTHDPMKWHGIWDPERGCHYDHEHGTSPFTPQVTAAFPGFDLFALLGNKQVGHTNPSSPAEMTVKHGGMKWQIDTNAPQGCAVGFEGGTVAVDAYAIQYHSFGRQDIELEGRNHTTASLLRQCKPDNPSDKGYVYVVQLQEYGERVMPYQGMTLPYPDNFQPQYDGSFGPYFTTECVGQDFSVVEGGVTKLVDCRDVGDNRSNNLSIWTSKQTGSGARPETSLLFRLLFRSRDVYQRLDSADMQHPYTWVWVCGGAAYNPIGCRFNNSTTTIDEIAGDIPAAWDGLVGFDLDPRVGRVTADGYVTRFGSLNPGCSAPGTDCYPIKLIGAFVGRYSSEVSAVKVSNPDPQNTPERDVYFCAGLPCSETSPGAVPSGWIGSEN